jgi:hypothetical protein
MPLVSSPLEAVTDSGLQVAVHHDWLYPEGAENDIFQAERGYRVTLSRNGEELQSFLLRTDVRITELEDGTFKIVALQDGQPSFEGSDGNDIMISQFAEHVSSGAGNDTIFALGKGVYDGGDGDDKFIIGGERSALRGYDEEDEKKDSYVNGRGAVIKGGSGDDTVVGSRIIDANIDLGEGDNSIYSSSIVINSTIKAGSGNNKAFVNGVRDSTIEFGDGNNTVAINTIDKSSLRLGHGGNDIYINRLADNDENLPVVITTGDGNNRMHIGGYSRGSHKITLGRGNNSVSYDFGAYLAGKYSFTEKDGLQHDVHEQFSRLLTNLHVQFDMQDEYSRSLANLYV